MTSAEDTVREDTWFVPGSLTAGERRRENHAGGSLVAREPRAGLRSGMLPGKPRQGFLPHSLVSQ